MPIQRQAYFAVLVSDIDASVLWYQTYLGLSVRDDTTGPEDVWRIVNLSNEMLHVEVIRDSRRQYLGVDANSYGVMKTGVYVADVRVIADYVERATGVRPDVSEFAPHNVRLMQLHDPDGATIQFMSPLSE